MIAVCLCVSVIGCHNLNSSRSAQSGGYHDGPLSPYDKQVEDVLRQMSLEEKAGQMTQVTLEMLLQRDAAGKIKLPAAFDQMKLDSALGIYRVGSILNNVGHTMDRPTWHRLLQEIHAYKTPAGRPALPVLYGVDAIHGANYTVGATLFPQEIGLAATWDPRFAEECGTVTAYETRASGIPWNFSPVLDLGRQPLWSRIFETFGEDVYLARAMARRIVKGYQGEALGADPEKVAACLKHFVGYSMPLTGKDRTPAWISDRQLKEYFLPIFQAGIDAGAQTLMINSGEINGIPVHASYDLLTTTLRGQMGFKGFTVSDWEDVKMLHSIHRVAATEREAVKMAVMAGMDMSMVPLQFDFATYLVDLVRSGDMPESRLDEAVRRILTVKFKLGLFADPLPNLAGYQKFGSKEFADIALNAARESVTLLKNDKAVLPLSKTSRVLVAGPGAHSLNALNGAWTHTWQGEETRFNTPGKATVFEAMRAIGGAGNVSLLDMSFADSTAPAIAQAAAKADVIVLCIGERPSTEKPGDIVSLDLSLPQQLLAQEAARTGKPIVLVLLEGRPRIISGIEPLAQGIVMAYLPGDEGGRAIAEVLYGDVNPSGKLPYTYPRYSGDLTHYDYKTSETKDPQFGTKAIHPQYAFGDGLSYTQFEYSDLLLSKASIGAQDSILISVTVTNTGTREGKEVVQLYVRDEYASVTPSVRRLRGFSKVSLKPGESKLVLFMLGAADLRFVDRDNRWRVEPGDYTAMIGPLSKSFFAAWDWSEPIFR
jgi:beta-glucosidase